MMRLLDTLKYSCTLVGLAMLMASPAAADRPSLIDLQAAVDGLIAPAPAAVNGSIVFDNTSAGAVTLDLVDLVLDVTNSRDGCTIGCASGLGEIAPLRATVIQAADVAVLAAELQSGSLLSAEVFIVIPGEKDPARILEFGNVILEKIENSEVAGRIVLQFHFETGILDWAGTRWGWDRSTSSEIALDCDPYPANDLQVDLSGNAPTNLGNGEIEARYQFALLGALSQGGFELGFSRTPPDGCFFARAMKGGLMDVSFERLWSSDDQFASRQAVESISTTDVVIDRWTFRIESGVVTEDVGLLFFPLISNATQTLRDSDPANGTETNSRTNNY